MTPHDSPTNDSQHRILSPQRVIPRRSPVQFQGISTDAAVRTDCAAAVAPPHGFSRFADLAPERSGAPESNEPPDAPVAEDRG